jgi:hypothetical protein
LRTREHERWEAQVDADSESGKLDFLFDEADLAAEQGTLREWPPAK